MTQFENFHGDLEEVVCPTCGPDQPARLVFKGDDGIGFYQFRADTFSYMFLTTAVWEIYTKLQGAAQESRAK